MFDRKHVHHIISKKFDRKHVHHIMCPELLPKVCACYSGKPCHLALCSSTTASKLPVCILSAMQDRNFQDNAEFFQDCFEVGRRFKIMNPDKMRAEYGKLIYMLMDSADDHIQNLLEFRCVRPLRTVYSLLEECNGLAVLDNPLVEVATAEIVAGEVLLIVRYLLSCILQCTA